MSIEKKRRYKEFSERKKEGKEWEGRWKRLRKRIKFGN